MQNKGMKLSSSHARYISFHLFSIPLSVVTQPLHHHHTYYYYWITFTLLLLPLKRMHISVFIRIIAIEKSERKQNWLVNSANDSSFFFFLCISIQVKTYVMHHIISFPDLQVFFSPSYGWFQWEMGNACYVKIVCGKNSWNS